MTQLLRVVDYSVKINVLGLSFPMLVREYLLGGLLNCSRKMKWKDFYP